MGIIYHRGLAEALGVSPTQLENMTVRALAVLAHHKGGRLDFGAHSGLGLGLTLSAKDSGSAANQTVWPPRRHRRAPDNLPSGYGRRSRPR